MQSKNNTDTSGYFHVNFILSLIALLITQSAHREYSSTGMNDIMISIQVLCHVDDFDARFCHKLGECSIYVRKHWNVC